MEVLEATAVSIWKGNDYENYVPMKLIDNDINTYYLSGDRLDNGCPETKYCVLWVQLDLHNLVIVRYVNIFNRKDVHRDRTSNVRLLVGNSKIDKYQSQIEQYIELSNAHECGKWEGKGEEGELIEIVCPTPQTGSVVIVHVADPGVYHINIAEIKVYGKGGKNIMVQNINIKRCCFHYELPKLF